MLVIRPRSFIHDGFNFAFIHEAWDFIKSVYYAMWSKYYHRGHLNKEINVTFITLIPKASNPVELKDFRPISLVGCDSKFLFKILANRLRRVLLDIISPS